MCLTEHHLNILQKTYVNIEGYTIGAQFCRVLYEKGGVIIYVHSSLQYINIDLSEYSKEKDIEICAVKLIINSLNMFIIAIYRAPSRNLKYFLQQLDNNLQSLSTPASHIIICGDLNITYLVENEQKKQLDNLLLMYNLMSIVNFPMRINNTSTSALDNFFIDASRYEDFSVIPF
jgi:exonuclease III